MAIFVDNLEYVGLVRELSNAKRVITIEQLVEDLQASKLAADSAASVPLLRSVAAPPAEPRPQPAQVRVQPGVHIDIQIHIDAGTTAEQIDLLFASMAKNLGMGPVGSGEKQ